MDIAADRRPLTAEQINWLRVNAYLPPLVLLGTLFVCVASSTCLLVTFPETPFLIGFVAAAGILALAAAALTLLYAYRNYMDLRDGVAQVRTARLIGKRRRKSARNMPRYYLRFEGLDELETLPETFDRLSEGSAYTVIYSPRVRRCWDAEAQQ
ncbi:MAG: hypothetical protein ACFLMY_18860 [Candidatus Brachytrichaceae bacterium NZ_4S206]|jgi:membrane protein implicated in regulation of membrane protease activity